MKATIIIVTRDRCADLKETLHAIRDISVPAGLVAEVLVVDNGSKDATAEVAKSAGGAAIPVRYLLESRPGKCNGLNLGMERAGADIMLFTDDDVRPPADWLDRMCDPILQGKADAVCGGVRLAPHLLRPWMTRMHRSWLASTEWIQRGDPQSLVGANMSLSGKVLDRVPGFDPELGPGAIGFCDDTLFSSQLLAAGFKFHDGMDVCIEHHFEPFRMNRESWLNAAKRRGESHAYVGHHWQHWNFRMGRLRVWRAARRLAAWRAAHPQLMAGDGCDEEELRLVVEHAQLQWRLKERGKPRKYEPHGLVKLGGLSNTL